MGVEALLTILERQARADAESRVVEARAEAGRIVARAEAEVERRRRLHLERVEGERRQDIARRRAATIRELRAGILRARADMLDGVFAAAADRLEAMSPADYAAPLDGLVRNALRYLEDRPAEARCRPALLERVRALAAEWPEVTVASDADTPPGVLARSLDGEVVVDGTLAGLLTRRRHELAILLLAGAADPDHAMG